MTATTSSIPSCAAARHLIAGELQDYATHSDVIDPATGKPFASCPAPVRPGAARAATGTTWINSHMGVEPGVPFGGIKQSGMGVEYAVQGLRGCMEPHGITAPARP